MPSIEVLARLEGQLCRLQPALCVNILAAICGYNPSNLDHARLPTYVNYTPSGTSVQNMAHWSQVRQGVCGCCICNDNGSQGQTTSGCYLCDTTAGTVAACWSRRHCP